MRADRERHQRHAVEVFFGGWSTRTGDATAFTYALWTKGCLKTERVGG
jgi:hypothetical protein